MAKYVCMDCGSGIPPVTLTGKFVCEPCFNSMIDRFNGKIEEEDVVKSTKEKVRELMDKNMKPKEIAEELEVSTALVYNYQSQIRKENTSVDEKSEAATTEESKELEYAKKYTKAVEARLAETQQLLHIKKESQDKLRQHYAELQTENLKLREELESSVATETEERLIEECNELEEAYNLEKDKHELLLNYLMLGKSNV